MVLQGSERSRKRGRWMVVLALLLCLVPLLKAEPTEVPVAAQEEEENLGLDLGLPDEPIETHHHLLPHKHAEEPHCAWGTACHPEYVDEAAAAAASEPKKSSNNNMSSSGNHIPFVHHHSTNPSGPPEGFTIVARVYTDPNDKLAHFTDDEEGSHITLPYWECGSTGSTTSPLPVKHAYFKNSLSGSKPQVWSGTEYGPHPQLVVALKRMEMTLNSGETKQLKPGDVVLLEDVVSGGHKLKALEGLDMTYLLLTLPQHYHHVGRDQMALTRTVMERNNPCANDLSPDTQQLHGAGKSAFLNRQPLPQPKDPPLSSAKSSSDDGFGTVSPLREPKLRKLILGALGVAVSTMIADFLGKVAPLWLAVGIGGTCFVVGGTFGIVQGGDYLCSEFEMWQERRRLDVPFMDSEDPPETSIPQAGATAS